MHGEIEMRKLVEKINRKGTIRWSLAAAAIVAFSCGYQFMAVPGQSETIQVPTGSGTGEQDPPEPAEQTPAHKYFTDVVLVNQNGEQLRLYSDLLRGKVVIINSFFATCQGSCLPMNRNLEKVQEALGDRVGKDVFIISISVDPTVDSPANLKEYANRLHAGPGWYFLTGEQQNVEFALKKLGQFVTDKQDHLNIFIIGNERTGLWKKAFGLASSNEIVKVVESVINDNPADAK
jgi:protein SCO1